MLSRSITFTFLGVSTAYAATCYSGGSALTYSQMQQGASDLCLQAAYGVDGSWQWYVGQTGWSMLYVQGNYGSSGGQSDMCGVRYYSM
jgi:hypothetical protein